MKRILLYCFIVLVVTACSSTSKSTKNNHSSTNISEEQLLLDAKMIEAKILQENGKKFEAMKRYDTLTKKDPKYAPAYYEMSNILLSVGMTDSALTCATQAAKLDETNEWYLIRLAKIHEARRDGKSQAQVWEKLVKQHPDNIDYYYQLSDAYILANDIPSAIAALERLEKRIGVQEATSLQKQRLWSAIGKEDQAKKEIEKLANAMPQEQKYNAILAEMCMKEHNYKQAKQYYDNILQYHPNDEYIHFSLAEYYKQTGDSKNAYESLKTGLQQSSMECRSKLQILAASYTTEEFYHSKSQEAFELMDIVMQTCSGDPAAALFYGDVLMRQEKYAEAVEQFRIHLATDSSEYEVWEALLVCENSAKGMEREALRDARRAAELFPLHILPYYMQGYYAFEDKDYAQAIKFLEQCEQLGFNNGYLEGETYALLAECHYRLDEYQQAWNYFDKCLKLDSKDFYTMNNYAYYLAQQNERLDYAESLSRKTIEHDGDNATFLDTYAWVLHQMGRDCEALEYIKKAVKIENQNKAEDSDSTLKSHLNTIQSLCTSH